MFDNADSLSIGVQNLHAETHVWNRRPNSRAMSQLSSTVIKSLTVDNHGREPLRNLTVRLNDRREGVKPTLTANRNLVSATVPHEPLSP
jgi:hypothetical protein